MELSNDLLALIVILLFILILIFGIGYAIFSNGLKSGSRVNSVTLFGATSEFQSIDQKAATEQILDEQANKKMTEEKSSDPDKK